MGNSQSLHGNDDKSNARRRSLFRSNSQEGVDPRVVHAALETAARFHPEIYYYRRPRQQQGQGQPGDGVCYPEEYEGNEPMDESWQQQPLEPECPSHDSNRNHNNNNRGRRRHSISSSLLIHHQHEAAAASSGRRRRHSHNDKFVNPASRNSMMSHQQEVMIPNLENFAATTGWRE